MSMTARITGPGVTERVNMVSADLGAVCYDPKRRAYAYVFGDNFAERYMRGEWQSPSIVMYDADHNLLGIPAGTTDIISSGNRRQALDYSHNAGGISTILPCDLNRFGSTWHLSGMVVGMGGLGDERATQFWTSKDLVNFTKTSVSLEHHAPGHHPGNVMLTYDRQKDWVYIFGTGGLSRNKPIWLWRCPADTFPEGWWEPWGQNTAGWHWGTPNENSPVLHGMYGELSFRFIQGQAVLSFFDVERYSCSAITQARATDNWAEGNRVDYAFGNQFPQLYGGYICPDSRLNEPNGMKFVVSQWNTSNNDPYHVIAFADTLRAVGPLIEPRPEPEPKPEPDDVAYGLPTGTNTGGYGSGGQGIFPQWVQDVGQHFGVVPSTYAGHQETDRKEAGFAPNPRHENRGIDWSGSPAQMRAMAEYLMQHPQLVEQLIYQDPETGKAYEIAGGKVVSGYYDASTLAGHRDHVHTRQSRSFTAGARPKPRPPVEGGAMGPQELYELLLRELSASGSEIIMNPEGEKLTLRQAIEEIHYKERGNHGLEGGRPRHPGQEDDQLGHVLNARAEGLFTQALVVALAEKAGIDAGKLYAQVQEALK